MNTMILINPSNFVYRAYICQISAINSDNIIDSLEPTTSLPYKIHLTTTSSLPIRFLASSAAASQIFLRTAGVSSSWIRTKICSLTAFWMFAGTWGQNSSKLFANKRRSSTGASVLTWTRTNSKNYKSTSSQEVENIKYSNEFYFVWTCTWYLPKSFFYNTMYSYGMLHDM